MTRHNRLLFAQLALFIVVSIGCTYYVVVNAFGPQLLHTPIRVTVRMPDSAGISRGSQVTYRGVQAGRVSDVRLEPTGAVAVVLSLNPALRIPADARAIVSMDTPIALQHVDLQPPDGAGPFLRDGSVIDAARTDRPLPLASTLRRFDELSASVEPHDIAVLSDALATGFHGTGPELTRILDNTASLMRTLHQRRPQLQRLLDNGRALIGPDQGDRLRALSASLRALSDGVRGWEPQLRTTLDAAPGTIEEIARLMADNEPAVTTLLGNLVTTSQIVSVRTSALEHGIVTVPGALAKLGGIVHGDTADFYLVGTQGPVCITRAQRRPPTDTAPSPPSLDWHCPADEPGLGQRGAANAPRPGTSDPAAGFQLGTSGGQSDVLGPRSWYAIPLQGVR